MLFDRCQQDYDFGEFFIQCSLDFGHEGPHYDDSIDMTWKEGKPDE